MKTVAIVQARMASSRLPGKVLADIAGRPMLDHVVKRARWARLLDLVSVATSEGPADDAVAQFCRDRSISCFRGSEADVLDRYYRAALQLDADVVVRLTADCPLLDPAVIDKVVRFFHEGDYDYVSNTLEPSYPDGLDTEVFRRDALERAWREARLASEREHVTPYIWNHPEVFRVANVRYDRDLAGLRWTVDEPEDLTFVRRIYEHFDPELPFGVDEILAFLAECPELGRVNSKFKRNEGYRASVQGDNC
jgi:spore coat polysaccharide biosynthesis protein SpsF